MNSPTFLVATILLMVMTVWVIIARFTHRLDTSWPLFYYLLMVFHTKVFEGGLNPYWVFVAVVSGLFLRFEFMGGFILRSIRVIELLALAYLSWECLVLVFGR